MNQDIKEKGVFVVGFLATALAFSSFKDSLEGIIVNFGSYSTNIFQLSEVFFALLALSAYLYALDYLRYNLGEYQNLFVFKAILFLANGFYFLALIYPICLFAVWIVVSTPIDKHPELQYTPISFISKIIGTVIGSLLGGVISYQYEKLKKRREVEVLETQKRIFLDKASRLYEQGLYSEAVLDIFKSVDQALREKLLTSKDLTSRHIPFSGLVHMIGKNEILNKVDISSLRFLLELRNSAVHLPEPLTKEQAKEALRIGTKFFHNKDITEKSEIDEPTTP